MFFDDYPRFYDLAAGAGDGIACGQQPGDRSLLR
jgi:hypothetical protein